MTNETTPTLTSGRALFPVPDLELCEVGQTGLVGLESYSPFCVKVHRTLRFMGLAYRCRHGQHPGVFRHLNPTGQVPVLLIDGMPVFDSTHIVERLEALAPDALHADLGPRDLCRARLWEELADTSLNGFVVAARWADDRNWPRTKAAFFSGAPMLVSAVLAPRMRRQVIRDLTARDVWRAGAAACWARYEKVLDQLQEQAPSRGFWVGPSISVADLSIFGQLHSLRCDLTPWQAERIEARPRLAGYLDRVDAATQPGRRVRQPGSRLPSAASRGARTEVMDAARVESAAAV